MGAMPRKHFTPYYPSERRKWDCTVNTPGTMLRLLKKEQERENDRRGGDI